MGSNKEVKIEAGVIMELIVKILTVIGLGVVELWVAIPTGMAFGLHPMVTGVASGIGSILGALLVILIGDRLRNWILTKRAKKEKGKGSSIYKVWEKYGVIGLGMLSPLITGAPLGAALGVSLGVPSKQLLLWMSIGISVWTIVLTGIGTFGIVVFG